MQNILKSVLLGIMMVFPLISSAKMIPFTENDCAKLREPKTVLLAHVTSCSHCRMFKPVYEGVSNLPKYQDWSFYEITVDDLYKVCGQQIDSYPSTFKNNMQKILIGARSQSMLEKFLDEK